jgi:hypothetical protein
MTSSDTLTRFMDAMRAASAAGVPLPWSRAELATFVQQVKTPHGDSIDRFESGVTIPRRFQSAVSVLEHTDSIELVLEGLAAHVLADRELSRVLRRTLIYLTGLLFVAATLAFAFDQTIAPMIDLFRKDLTLLPSLPTQHHGTTGIAGKVAVFLGGGFCLLCIATLVGGSSLITSLMGGRSYQNIRESAVALQIADLLQQAGQRQAEALSLACDVVDVQPGVQETLSQLAGRNDVESVSSANFKSMARAYRLAATSRLATLRSVLPVVFLVVVGGSAVMSYGLAVFWPIVTLLQDMSLPGGRT